MAEGWRRRRHGIAGVGAGRGDFRLSPALGQDGARAPQKRLAVPRTVFLRNPHAAVLAVLMKMQGWGISFPKNFQVRAAEHIAFSGLSHSVRSTSRRTDHRRPFRR